MARAAILHAISPWPRANEQLESHVKTSRFANLTEERVRETRHLALTKLQIERDFLLLAVFARPIRGSAPGTMFARRFGSPRWGCNCCLVQILRCRSSRDEGELDGRIFSASSLFRMILTPLPFRYAIFSPDYLFARCCLLSRWFARDREFVCGSWEFWNFVAGGGVKRGIRYQGLLRTVAAKGENIALAIKFFSPNISRRIFIYTSRRKFGNLIIWSLFSFPFACSIFKEF